MLSSNVLKTPNFAHIAKKFKETVYEPSEDTFLLIDALEKDFENIARLRPLIILEVGSGSGVVISAIALALNNAAFCLCTDINKCAAKASIETASANETVVEAIVTNLVTGLLPRISGLIDILIFNPPYVVTPDEEVGTSDLSASWAGGQNGRQVMDKLFLSIKQLLSPTGIFYLVIIKENNKDDIERMMLSIGFTCDVVISRKSGPEHLSVLKFAHSKQ